MAYQIAFLRGAGRSGTTQYLLATLGAIFVAFTLSIGSVIAMVAAVAAVAAVFLVGCYAAMAVAPDSGRRDVIFWIMIALLFAVPFVHKVIFPSVDPVLELFVMGAVVLAVPSATRWFQESAYALAVLFLLLVFVAWSLLSSGLGRSTWLAATFQFLFNLKFFCMLMVGFYVAWTGRTERAFWGLVRWVWFPLLLLVAWQWLSPGSYTALINHYAADARQHHPFGLPGRAMGPFFQSSMLADITALFMAFALAKGLIEERRGYFVVAFLYFLLIVASGQRQELAAAPVLVLLVMSAESRRFALPIVGLGAVAVILAGLWLVDRADIENIEERFGVEGYEAIVSPRPVFYLHAWDIAQKSAPLGSGLGTFGAGAERFDPSYFVDLGFRQYSWFGVQKGVFVDTFWPNLFAETGWIGAALMLLITVALILYALKESLKPRQPSLRLYWLMALAGQAFPFLVSPTSSMYQNPGLYFLGAMFFGIAYNATRRSESAASAGAPEGLAGRFHLSSPQPSRGGIGD